MRRWMVLVVAPLLAACGSAGSLAQRTYTPLPSPSGPFPTPEPDVSTVYAVPASVASTARPVFWVAAGDRSLTLVAYDWNGVRTGSVQVSKQARVLPSPDGTRILVAGSALLSGATALSHFPGRADRWANDDQHVCLLGPPPGALPDPLGPAVKATLAIADAATGAVRIVATAGSYGPHSQPRMLACSAADDIAIVGEEFVGQTGDLQAIRLSNGRPAPATFPSNGSREGDFVVSGDGRYITAGSTDRLSGPAGFAVSEVRTGTPLSSITRGGMVAFSGDDTRALIIEYLNNSNERGRYSIVDWRSGRVLWSKEVAPGFDVVQPHGGGFVVGDAHYVEHPETNNRSAVVDLLVVHGDGTLAATIKDAGPLQW